MNTTWRLHATGTLHRHEVLVNGRHFAKSLCGRKATKGMPTFWLPVFDTDSVRVLRFGVPCNRCNDIIQSTDAKEDE